MKLIDHVCPEGHKSTIIDLEDKIPGSVTLVECLTCGLECPRCAFIASGVRVITRPDYEDVIR